MSRLLLFSAIAALTALVSPVQAHHHHDYVHGRFVGFLDYRHSLDDGGRYGRDLDARREYVFHRMSGREAYEVWHGGGHDGGYHHRHDNGRHDMGARPLKSRHWHGGGHHNHAWGVHASDNACNH